ncbi:hypothetical protein AX14_005249 [Amanita brunnescens Koide BX004]|nr:hypothetical protein AX14_005249 [Amanita brunnescens Koide BX004]
MPPTRSDKVKAVRIPSARPTGSASSPSDDWIWTALDTARNAAMTNELARIPSIKAIADVFTRMLECLHAMKKNRDDFCVITNEIASLIESVVKYAREHDPVCERYKGVCDNFLSTISTIQSEMEQILGIPTKRSPKAKAYQTVLSSYQFRVGCLHRDLQALTLSSSIPSSTGLLSNAREVAISGGTFMEIHGNQYQYIFHNGGTEDVQTLLDDATGRMDDLDFSDYIVLKYGDLRATSTPQRRYQLHDVIHNQIMTARTYRGKSALLSFKNDAKMILEHNFRHQHLAQLFGVCLSSKVPTLIFHGEHKRLSIHWNIAPREKWLQRFQMHGELQGAFRYLMQELQLGHPTHPTLQLTPEGQFLDFISVQEPRQLYCMLPEDVDFDNCSCHLYMDNCQRLQVSIMRFLANRI